MPRFEPFTNRELRTLLVDSTDYTFAQAKEMFAQYRQVEDEMPDDNYAATLTNMFDAIFYIRFGGQWRASAAPHVFQPTPLARLDKSPPRAKDVPAIPRTILRELFSR